MSTVQCRVEFLCCESVAFCWFKLHLVILLVMEASDCMYVHAIRISDQYPAIVQHNRTRWLCFLKGCTTSILRFSVCVWDAGQALDFKRGTVDTRQEYTLGYDINPSQSSITNIQALIHKKGYAFFLCVQEPRKTFHISHPIFHLSHLKYMACCYSLYNTVITILV